MMVTNKETGVIRGSVIILFGGHVLCYVGCAVFK